MEEKKDDDRKVVLNTREGEGRVCLNSRHGNGLENERAAPRASLAPAPPRPTKPAPKDK